ncbi:hypothetical protein MMC11_004863 [Xylographa trunciseda]|nr:hypothetical protein [Xylographa trunciseda]
MSSMLTPVRVRGKNKRDQSRKKNSAEEGLLSTLPVPKRGPGRPRKSKRAAVQLLMNKTVPLPVDVPEAPEAVATHSRRLSTLEQLPTELLQTIFLLSKNINFPISSLHLGSVLASPLLRTELVVHAFTELECFNQSRYTELQCSLLRQKWLTYDFFQHCQKTYLLRRAILVIQKYSKEAAGETYRRSTAKITQSFDTYYNLGHRISMKLDRLRRATGMELNKRIMNLSQDVVFVATDHEKVTYSIVLDFEGNCMKVFRPWVAGSGDSLRPKDFVFFGETSHVLTVDSVLSCVSLTQCEIPEKLLHGPWTSERGYFLSLLLDANAKVNWLGSTSGEVALQGLEDAIREDNSHAIKILRASDINACSRDTTIRTFRECIEDLKSEVTTVEELTNPYAPWRIPASNSLLDTPPAGVVPSTKHLKIAVLEKAANFRVLQALLEGGGKTDIDCDDTELVDWALQKKAEARVKAASLPNLEGQSVGDWLLDTLEVVREKQRTQEI